MCRHIVQVSCFTREMRESVADIRTDPVPVLSTNLGSPHFAPAPSLPALALGTTRREWNTVLVSTFCAATTLRLSWNAGRRLFLIHFGVFSYPNTS